MGKRGRKKLKELVGTKKIEILAVSQTPSLAITYDSDYLPRSFCCKEEGPIVNE
jgi:hypothetical protein